MGIRGPQPVDVERLKMVAKRWAALLFGVRGGAAGVVERWGQKLSVQIVSQVRRPQERDRVERLLEKMQEEGWQVSWPLWPSPKVWEQLKVTRTVTGMSKSIAALRKWRRQNANLVASDDVLRIAESDPLVFLRAMRLPNYPRNAKTNDDKRILFLSKVLAGLELGVAPLTATKKLSYWRCENYWETVGVQYVASFRTGLPVYPGSREIDLQEPSIGFSDSRARVEVVTECYSTVDSLEKVEEWYVKRLGRQFKRRSSGNQGPVVHRKLSIRTCDEAFISDDNDLVWAVAMKQKQEMAVEIGLARIGKAENRRLYRKEERR